MPSFSGFPSGKVRLVQIPSTLFTELLPEIDHLGELKVTLYVLWCLEQMEGNFRYLRYNDLLQDERFLSSLSKDRAAAAEMLRDGLERGVVRGSLLKAEIVSDTGNEMYYFLNSPRGRAALRAIQAGDWVPTTDLRQPVGLNLERPNIFRLYEENIGPLTPMIAETLREAEQTFPADWIEEAIRTAVENNVRRWRYVEAILNSWQEEKRDEQYRGDYPKDRRQYIQGEFRERGEP
jgi:DnaD/phage-associated family protein